MSVYLVEGLSGTGKTTVCEALKKRGYYAVEADEQFGYYADPKTGLPTDKEHQLNWVWDKERFENVIKDNGSRDIFICGGAMNQEEFAHYFDKIFTLRVDDETLKHRLLNRINNPFGKDPADLARQLEWNKGAVSYSKQRGTMLIDASKPLDDVVSEILAETKTN